jgi:beta-apo-4'-carotenal oxygenase
MNDGFFHASVPNLPFGGVGGSGQGAYHGKDSFDCFTHRRSVTTTPAWVEGLMDIRYPPFTTKKENKYKSMNKIKPDFDREGRSIGWFAWAMGLVGLKSLAAVVGT